MAPHGERPLNKTTIMKNLFQILMPIMLFIIIGTACRKTDLKYRPTLQHQPVVARLVHVAYDIEDADKQTPSGDATLLWDNHRHAPILAPDGHQLTLSEFNSVSGNADIKYLTRGTRVALTVKGLIPNGVYSIWLHTFQAPGFHGSLINLIGNGALATGDGRDNNFTASIDGTTSISTMIYNEALSISGAVGICLCSEYEAHVVVAYHSADPGNIGDPHNPDSWVAQFAFQFKGGS